MPRVLPVHDHDTFLSVCFLSERGRAPLTLIPSGNRVREPTSFPLRQAPALFRKNHPRDCLPVFCGAGLVFFLCGDLFSPCPRSQIGVPWTVVTLCSTSLKKIKEFVNWNYQKKKENVHKNTDFQLLKQKHQKIGQCWTPIVQSNTEGLRAGHLLCTEPTQSSLQLSALACLTHLHYLLGC